jgi:hypothetical protein
MPQSAFLMTRDELENKMSVARRPLQEAER